MLESESVQIVESTEAKKQSGFSVRPLVEKVKGAGNRALEIARRSAAALKDLGKEAWDSFKRSGLVLGAGVGALFLGGAVAKDLIFPNTLATVNFYNFALGAAIAGAVFGTAADGIRKLNDAWFGIDSKPKKAIS